MTDAERMACIEAWSSGSWGDRLGEIVRICIAVEQAPTTPQPARKIGGSYQADGYIVSRFTTTAGAERVVFEFNEPKGMLHIFTPEQIEEKA